MGHYMYLNFISIILLYNFSILGAFHSSKILLNKGAILQTWRATKAKAKLILKVLMIMEYPPGGNTPKICKILPFLKHERTKP